jgi:hypothetical protein
MSSDFRDLRTTVGRAMLCRKQEGEISEGSRTAAGRAEQFDTAYRSLRGDGKTQFDLPPAMPEAPPPAWVEALGRFFRHLFEPVGRFLRWVGSFMPEAAMVRFLLWTVIALAVAVLVLAVVQRIRLGEWRWRRRAALIDIPVDEEWRPDASPLRAWLEEADALARQGRFADAIHCLLLRSIDDLAKRRPELARPSLTGRELAHSPLLPARAQTLFAAIADIVERSLFGNRPVEEAQWAEARRSYSEFALAGTWRQ